MYKLLKSRLKMAIEENERLKQEDSFLRKQIRDQEFQIKMYKGINEMMLIQAGPLYKEYMRRQADVKTAGNSYTSCMRFWIDNLGLDAVGRIDTGIAVGDYWVGVEF
jgi:regulator of replication initiation timing